MCLLESIINNHVGATSGGVIVFILRALGSEKFHTSYFSVMKVYNSHGVRGDNET